MNPFDLKSALLAKHAQHVVLIHFPIALFLMGTGFDLASRWAKDTANRTTLAAAARLNILAAAVLVVPTLMTGILAWRWALEGQRLKGVLLLHLILGSLTSVLMWLAAWIHLRKRHDGRTTLRFALEILTAALVGITAHLGGFLSGVNLG